MLDKQYNSYTNVSRKKKIWMSPWISSIPASGKRKFWLFTSRCNHFREITTILESSPCDNVQHVRVHHRNSGPKSPHDNLVKLLSRCVLLHISILLKKIIRNEDTFYWVSLIFHHTFPVFYFLCVVQQDILKKTRQWTTNYLYNMYVFSQ